LKLERGLPRLPSPRYDGIASAAAELQRATPVIGIKHPDIRRLLIGFARLSKPRRKQFLNALNRFMYASPQRQRLWLQEWDAAAGTVTARNADTNTEARKDKDPDVLPPGAQDSSD